MKLSILYQAKASLFLPIGCMLFLIHPQASIADHKPLQNFLYKNSTDGRFEVILNEKSTKAYADIHMLKWGIFENYFKGCCYLDAKKEEACARFNYFEIVISP